MRVVLGLVCALVACGDPASVGALIDVVAPADLGVPVDQIKLFIGLPGQLDVTRDQPRRAGRAGHRADRDPDVPA